MALRDSGRDRFPLGRSGVEGTTTGSVLADLGCDVAQGYAVARPMPVRDFLDWLRRTHVFAFDGTLH